jgi:lipoprotein-releasing system permease protein
MFRPFFLYIGSRYTNLRKRDHFITFLSIISMVGIALGVTVLITVLSVMNGFTKEIRERMLSVTPHIMVDNWGQPLNNWQGVANKLSKYEEVEAAGPYIDGQGMFTRSGEVRGAVIKGIEPEAVDAVFPLRTTLIQGDVNQLKAGDFTVILGSSLAHSLGVQVGDYVTLVIPEVTVSMAGVVPRLKRLKVVGLFEVGYLYDSGYAFVHIKDAAKLFKTQGGVSGVQLRLHDPFTAPRVARQMSQDTKGEYHLIDWTVMNSAYFSAVKMEKTMMFFTLMMILAIAVFNLVSTLVMVVTDKRADIAVLRVLGASTRKVMAIFVAQGAIIGVIGTLIGVILGVTLALNVTDLVSLIERTFQVKFLSQDVYFISFLPSKLELNDVITIGLSSLTLSLLATIHPAYRAANIQPAEALRYDA